MRARCKLCRGVYTTHSEKQTDVKLASYLIKQAVNNNYDKALLITADSDLAPAIKLVNRLCPGKTIH